MGSLRHRVTRILGLGGPTPALGGDPVYVAQMLQLAVALVLIRAASAQDVEEVTEGQLYRVERPDAPGALATSATGSVVREPPTDGTPYRVEALAQPHGHFGAYAADDAAEVIGAEAWHEAGYTGEGVKLAVFDVQWFGSELGPDELGDFDTHDCWAHPGCTPAMDTTAPRFSYEEGSHGLACAELVRDLAPGVELHLVRTNGYTTFENAAKWSVREGVDLATLSMSFMNDSFYDGTGPVSELVEEMSEGGVLLVTSAGNYAEGHWLGWFTDEDGDDLHEFSPGVERLPVELPGGARRGVTLQWDNYARCGDLDLDARIVREDGAVLARGEATQAEGEEGCSPVERLSPVLEDDALVYLEVRRRQGDPRARLRVLTTSGDLPTYIREGSITDPGAHRLAFTVGAVRADGYLTNEPEYFSSWGPTAGGALKPDIAAPDGVTTSVYGASGFYGTSAASPVAAAAVALVMSRFPEMTAFEAAEWLKDHAATDRSLRQAPHDGLGAGHLVLPPPDGQGRACWGSDAWRGALFVIPFALMRRRRRRH